MSTHIRTMKQVYVLTPCKCTYMCMFCHVMYDPLLSMKHSIQICSWKNRTAENCQPAYTALTLCKVEASHVWGDGGNNGSNYKHGADPATRDLGLLVHQLGRRNIIFGRLFPRNRFEQIFWILHVSRDDPTNPQKKINKVKEILHLLLPRLP